jgi:hypothetical protein
VDVVTRELGDARAAHEGHARRELVAQQLDRASRARLATGRETVEHRAPAEARACRDRQRLDDVRTAPDAAVQENLGVVGDRVGDRRQRGDARDRRVELGCSRRRRRGVQRLSQSSAPSMSAKLAR